MNKKKQILESIRKLMKFNSDVTLLTIELEDKVIQLNSEALEVGSTVSLVKDEVITLVEDDSLDGVYTHNEMTFTILNGVITEVNPVEEEVIEEEEEVIELAVEEELEEVTAEIITPVYDYVTQIETLTNRVTIYEEQILELRTVQENFSSALKSVETYLNDTPADTATTTNNFKSQSNLGAGKATALEAIRNIRTK